MAAQPDPPEGMEIFISNVAVQGTAGVLKSSLRLHLLALDIRPGTADCDKWNGKPWATLTFLEAADGEKFLRYHGQHKPNPNDFRSVPVDTALYKQLYFANQKIFFARSSRAANPLTVRTLAREDKEHQLQMIVSRGHPKPQDIFPVIFATSFMSCGTWTYEGSDLVYAPEVILPSRGLAKFGRRNMILTMDSGLRIDFRYSAVFEITAQNHPTASFTFSMQEAPRFFRQISRDPVAEAMELLTLKAVPKKAMNLRKGVERHRIPALNAMHEPIAGNCFVFRIEGLVALSSGRGIGHVASTEDTMKKLSKAPEIPRMILRHTDVRMPQVSLASSIRVLDDAISTFNCPFPFQLRFQIHKLSKNNFLHPTKILRMFPVLLAMLDRSGPIVTISAVQKLFHQIPFPSIDTEASDLSLEAIIELLGDNEVCALNLGVAAELDANKPKNVTSIHRARVTPTSITFSGPQLESNNRILRKYKGFHDYFMRVSFGEEDGEPLMYHSKVSNYHVYHGRFQEILDSGVNIGGRVFSFLGFSQSSLRERSYWFVAPFEYLGSLLPDRDIIGGLGNFTLIRSPAKCAARIGQAFSDTRIVMNIDPLIVRNIEDIKRNGYVFSDGCGTISLSLLQKIWDKMPKGRLMPTCLQIRYRGAKGMVSLDSRLDGDQLCLRDSMIKFEGSTSNDIEICDATYRPLPVYMNRQFIKIMEDQHVKDSFFMDLQAKEITYLRMITESPINASSFLKRQGVGDSFQFPELILRLAAIGINFKDDGFLFHTMEAVLMSELRKLKHKARIPVPRGWHLHGIMDETGFLKEGEIFCVGVEEGVKNVITSERLVITRAPALSPGDVRTAKAVMPPPESPLMELRNCVVFSQHGKRDLASQLGGGDLDGDRFYVIWDDDALPEKEFEAVEYPRPPPVDIGRPVQREDITQFCIDHQENERLGSIAVGHRIAADYLPGGTDAEKCKTFAMLHGVAVDFPKTGIPVDPTQIPKMDKWRPHFEAPGPHVKVEKFKGITLEDVRRRDPQDEEDEDDDFKTYRYYPSTNIIGRLFDAIDEQGIFQEIRNCASAEAMNGFTVLKRVWEEVQVVCQLIEWKYKIEWAWEVREMYEGCMHAMMHDYSGHPRRALTELEAFAGTIFGQSGAASRNQRELTTTLKEQFEGDSLWITNYILRDGEDWSEEALARTLACFCVSLEDRPTTHSAEEQLVSFKYLAASLCLREVDKISKVHVDL
ncbi:hypothetical protein LZ554_008045 [Drepanopeziza brunnea f. sp. 'monogermtubi']|nr:hypothetical protein LZ554_008045 [Drepanopeziza brunnea f. sp. 'monogermtubi']